MNDADDRWIQLARQVETLEAMWAQEKILRLISCHESEAKITQFVTSLRRTPTMTRMLRNLSEVLIRHGSGEQQSKVTGLAALRGNPADGM